MNYALNFARGEIIGVYDAEDAPAPDQLQRVARRFAAEGPRTACLQGALNFYNAPDSWITRAFALDYAIWFRLVLPALSRLDAVVPLGGTTVFFRRAPLEEVGGWDAHNVTEDADLGVRLRRHGYRCALFDGVTLEEATARPWPWVRQRSRWLKGYALTWGVHMRAPRELLRQLGPAGTLWFQMLFLGALGGFALAPFLWLCWLEWPMGRLSFLPDWAPRGPWMLVPLSFAAAVQMACALRSAKLAGLTNLVIWAPALWPYFALGSAAFYKALVECAACPFYWDKTAHGETRRPARPD
jgi:cellulose synthase/poly-beta-1,6-N-acetylglucosamine synthase-like glycosyltransferase